MGILIVHLAVAAISHDVELHFDDARTVRVREEITSAKDDPFVAPFFGQLRTETTARGKMTRRVLTGTLTDETGLGLALQLRFISGVPHRATVAADWPLGLSVHQRPTGGVRATSTIDGPRRVITLHVRVEPRSADTPREVEPPGLQLSTVTSWDAVARAYTDGDDALPAAIRAQAAGALPRLRDNDEKLRWVRTWLKERAPRIGYSGPRGWRTLEDALAASVIRKAEAVRIGAALLRELGIDAMTAFSDATGQQLSPELPNARVEAVLVFSFRLRGFIDLLGPSTALSHQWQLDLMCLVIDAHHSFFQRTGSGEPGDSKFRVETQVTFGAPGAPGMLHERQVRTGQFHTTRADEWLPNVAHEWLGATLLEDLRIIETDGRTLRLHYCLTGVTSVKLDEQGGEVPISLWLSNTAADITRHITGEGPVAIVAAELTGVTRFRMPAGMRLFGVSNIRDSSPTVDWEQLVEEDDGDVTITRKLVFKKRVIEMGEMATAHGMLRGWSQLPVSAHLIPAAR